MNPLPALASLAHVFLFHWRYFRGGERVLVGALAFLALVSLALTFWAGNVATVVAMLLWTLALAGASLLAFLTAADRVSDVLLTASYLGQYTGEHVHVGGGGKRYRFDDGRGWVLLRS